MYESSNSNNNIDVTTNTQKTFINSFKNDNNFDTILIVCRFAIHKVNKVIFIIKNVLLCLLNLI